MSQAPATQPFDPVARIQAILTAERKPPEPVKAEPVVEAPVEAQPETEAPAGPNTQVEGTDAPKEDAPKALEIPEDQLEALEVEVTVKGEDGKDVLEKVSIKDLKAQRMMHKDYSRKTAELARQREQADEKVRQAVESEKKAYSDNLQLLNNLVLETAAQELKDVNWNDLAANDPIRYVQLRNRADQYTGALNTIKGKQAELEARSKSEKSQAEQKAARDAWTKLEADIPSWNEDLYKQTLKVGAKYGFTENEVATWVDPRAIKLLHAVHEFEQLKPGNPSEKKVVVPPKVVKPGAAQSVTVSQQKANEAFKQLQSKGTIEAAADVIRSRMRG